ncbi:hypothetical protein DFH08DRAFT_821852 [Mycena albidolilacea]|uniref:Uncharacterized protein n=1 Tax=Mycena albidolilacea TaxID=1033008 RepID=A0AAD6Z9E3_9AGAR|nr:hypothetical protein DFH08DRAFT_821852 [Mycena albidolilacea]
MFEAAETIPSGEIKAYRDFFGISFTSVENASAWITSHGYQLYLQHNDSEKAPSFWDPDKAPAYTKTVHGSSTSTALKTRVADDDEANRAPISSMAQLVPMSFLPPRERHFWLACGRAKWLVSGGGPKIATGLRILYIDEAFYDMALIVNALLQDASRTVAEKSSWGWICAAAGYLSELNVCQCHKTSMETGPFAWVWLVSRIRALRP